MVKKVEHILGIDRGSKYIGLAYMTTEEQIPMPIGYVTNDGTAYYTISDYFYRYHIKKVVVGRPANQKDVQVKIQKFIDDLIMIVPADTVIDKINEDYSTVQAGEIISNFKKNVATDAVSAMVILDRYRD